MTKDNSTLIAVVLDRSGSMSSIRDATMHGFNEFLKGQKAEPGEATLTLAEFDHEYMLLHHLKPLADVEPLNAETYQPRGVTALLDAIGRTITDVGSELAARPEADRPSKVVFVIQTDGYENASHDFTREKVFSMITEQREKYGWQFLFLAANQDAIQTGVAMGMHAGHTMTYAATPDSAMASFASASASVSSTRSGSARDFTDDEREKSLR